jgi:hypothetical protein
VTSSTGLIVCPSCDTWGRIYRGSAAGRDVHQIAVTLFEGRQRASKSQLPMMAVMVLYTIVGLLLLTRATSDPVLP